ncbi:MAG: hypothetical protein MUF45_14270 [Spirosomaceae bacterium]|jgi:hypothetical protein|nr:hypothetical protein [Spirosomataceae bacterium]
MIQIIKKYYPLGIAFVFSFLWLIGCSSDLSKLLYNQGFLQDDYRYGDLYRLSNLPQFRIPVEKCSNPALSKIKNSNLILLGDSFTEEGRIGAEHFITEGYKRYFVAADTNFTRLDTSKTNVLIIETVERHVRERFAKPFRNLKIVNSPQSTHLAKEKKGGEVDILKDLQEFEIPYKTERHESALFSSDFALSIKEAKAWFNWKFFDRTDSMVVVTKDGQNILYGVDVKNGVNSCFDEVSDDEIDKIVENLNDTYNHYRKLGFDEVYLTICPNKTSIVAPNIGKYNRIIERIQLHQNLKMPFFDVFSPFSSSKTLLYDKGDTHWNCAGKQVWIDKVNESLKKIL